MAFVAITQDCGLGAKVARDSTVCNGRGCVPKLYLQSQPWSSGLILLVMKTGLLDPVIPWAGVREHLGHSPWVLSWGGQWTSPPPQTGSTWTVIFPVFFVLGLLEQEKHVLTSAFSFYPMFFNTYNLPFSQSKQTWGLRQAVRESGENLMMLFCFSDFFLMATFIYGKWLSSPYS